jgi:hypothetical protein
MRGRRICRRDDLVLSWRTRRSEPVWRVDIGPAQSGQLALPHPGGDRQDVEGLQPVAVDGSEEGAGLVSREDPEVVASLAHYRGSAVEDGQTRLQRP